jgi:ankyrin repeat protein
VPIFRIVQKPTGLAGVIAAGASLVVAAGAFGQGPADAPKAAAPPAGPSVPGGPPPGDPLGPDLFIAISHNKIADMKALIAQGAKVDETNWLGLTPLMWAAGTGNPAACATLLDAGAKVNAPSHFGTALTYAEMSGNSAVVRLLIERGAKLTGDRIDGITPLMTAAENGRVETMRFLIERFKPDVNAKDAEGTTALLYAARRGQTEAVRLLLDSRADVHAADNHGRTALMYAAMSGYAATTSLLVERRAAVNGRDKAGNTALILAARYAGDAGVVRALLAGGADPNLKDAKGRTARSIAAARQNRDAAVALQPGATLAAYHAQAPLATRARQSATVSLALIEKGTKTFTGNAACISCHHQGLGLMTTGLAKERGFNYDKALALAQTNLIKNEDASNAKELAGVLPHPEMYTHVPAVDMGEFAPGITFAYTGLLAHGERAGEPQQAATVILASQQYADGHWGFLLHREPIQSSQFGTTAMAIRLMKIYMPKDHAAEAADRVAKAKAWLIATQAASNEDRTWRLLGLKWSGASAEEITKATAELRRTQRPDGGWAQFAPGEGMGMASGGADAAYIRSDAYATGQALYALHMGGGVATTSEPYKRGVAYLLRTQDDDGSWLVTKRAVPANTFMDFGFPHGESQYISYGATCWATMALILAAQPDAPKATPQIASVR